MLSTARLNREFSFHALVAISVIAAAAACSSDDGNGGGGGTTTDSGSSSGADSASSSGGTDAGGSSSGAADAGGSSSGGADAGGSSSGGTDAGGSSSGGTDAGGSSSGGADAGAKPDFYKLDGKGKQDFMKKHVLPAMTKILQEVDATKFADVKCTTCHGPNGFKNNWKMPADDGPKPLDPKAMPPMGKWPLTDAMYKKVVPQIKDILGAEPFDPKTGKGFGCFSCHAMKK